MSIFEELKLDKPIEITDEFKKEVSQVSDILVKCLLISNIITEESQRLKNIETYIKHFTDYENQPEDKREFIDNEIYNSKSRIEYFHRTKLS